MLRLSSAQEDYLEAILGLIHQTGSARVGEIAARLRVAKPSVTAALRALSRRRLVVYEPYRRVRLTEAGQAIAERVSRRHASLRVFLADVLGVDRRTADENACRIEHAIGDAVLRRLTEFIAFMAARSVPSHRLPAAFRAYLRRPRGARRRPPSAATASPRQLRRTKSRKGAHENRS